MSDASRRPLPPPRPYGVRPTIARPVYGTRPVVPVGGAGTGAISGALGAIGGTLGCLLCLASIGALGLFATVIAITAYTKQFLDEYRRVEQVDGGVHAQVGLILLLTSLFYTLASRIQRN